MWIFRAFISASILILTGCQIYSSSGRKDFESRSPGFIVNQALIGCELAQPTETEDLLSRSFFENEHFAVTENAQSVRVLQKISDEVCYYEFVSVEEWLSHKNYFLENLK
jgi:hypothetical protein